MNSQLVFAINSRNRVKFKYDGELRTVEPYRYGRSMKGDKDLLRGYQLINHAHPLEQKGWRLFDVSGISGIEILNDHITTLQSDYGFGDKQMLSPYFAEIRR